MGRGERVWLYIRATTEDVFLSPYCVYPISGGRQECMAPTCTNSESESAATFKHTEQTGLISEENQTPAAVCCSPHPLSQKLSLTSTRKKNDTLRDTAQQHREKAGAENLQNAPIKLNTADF